MDIYRQALQYENDTLWVINDGTVTIMHADTIITADREGVDGDELFGNDRVIHKLEAGM